MSLMLVSLNSESLSDKLTQKQNSVIVVASTTLHDWHSVPRLSYDVCLEVRGEIIRTVLCCIVY